MCHDIDNSREKNCKLAPDLQPSREKISRVTPARWFMIHGALHAPTNRQRNTFFEQPNPEMALVLRSRLYSQVLTRSGALTFVYLAVKRGDDLLAVGMAVKTSERRRELRTAVVVAAARLWCPCLPGTSPLRTCAL